MNVEDPLIAHGPGLAARRAECLLVGMPRWNHEGESSVTSDEYARLRDIGFGDPYQFAATGCRLPVAAFAYWEDTIASAGQVIDGNGVLWTEPTGQLWLRITPKDGSEPLDLPVTGVPAIATQCPHQRHPDWASRDALLAEALPDPVRWLVDQARSASVPVVAVPLQYDRNYAGYSLRIGTWIRIDVTGPAGFVFPRELAAVGSDINAIVTEARRQLERDEPSDIIDDFECRYLASAHLAARYRALRQAERRASAN